MAAVLSLDVIDISGELQRDISHNIIKTRLTETGTVVPGSQKGELRNDIDKLNEQRASGYCGSCYGGEPPEGGCCNSCDSVREAYTQKGWSFGNPSSIEQVRTSRILTVVVSERANSASRNIGPSTYGSRPRRAATSPVSSESTRSLGASTSRPDGPSSRPSPSSMISFHTSRTTATATTSHIPSTTCTSPRTTRRMRQRRRLAKRCASVWVSTRTRWTSI